MNSNELGKQLFAIQEAYEEGYKAKQKEYDYEEGKAIYEATLEYEKEEEAKQARFEAERDYQRNDGDVLDLGNIED